MVVSAKLLHTGKTSLRAAVEVGVGDPKEGPYAKTTRCVIVFVAPGDGGMPVEVERWGAEIGPRRVAPEHRAERLMGLRKDTEGRRWVPRASCLEVDPARSPPTPPPRGPR